MAYYIPLGGVGVVRDNQGAGKELTVRCIWKKKHNSCGECFLWGRACAEVMCGKEEREDCEEVMFEEYSEGAKNTEQANQPDNSCEHSFSPVYQCVHCGKIGDSIA